jgi:hypothetical protein
MYRWHFGEGFIDAASKYMLEGLRKWAVVTGLSFNSAVTVGSALAALISKRVIHKP